MAKVLLVLAIVILLLNAMTFLLVVGQGGNPEKAPPPGPAGKGSPEVQSQRLDQIVQTLQGVQKSLTDVSRKVDEVQRKVQLAATRTLSPAPSPPSATPDAAGAPAPGASGSRVVPAVRRGPTAPSSAGSAARAQSQPADEVEDDNAADHPTPRRVIGSAPPGGETPTDEAAPGGTGGEPPAGDSGAAPAQTDPNAAQPEAAQESPQ